jgi:flagellin
MGMVVQHNITAMNSNRMLATTTADQAKATEKLSSGFKINRAADDASGLSISEKMRRQIRGLTQASANAQDGISCVQTAEGALGEVHSMLQRMDELATKAATGTMSRSDRQDVQNEIDNLLTEIDRVSETTKFNETYLLKGTAATGTASNTAKVFLKAHDAGITGTFSVTHTGASKSTATLMVKLKTGTLTTTSGTVQKITIGSKTYRIVSDEVKATTSAADVKTVAEAVNLIGKALKMANSIGVDKTDATASATIEVNAGGTKKSFAPGKLNKSVDSQNKNGFGLTLNDKEVATGLQAGTFSFTITAGTAVAQKDLNISLHVGADADMTNKIGLDIKSMDTKGLGISGLTVMDELDEDQTGEVATYAIDAIEDAIKRVSEQRSALGAVQNRIEHTIKNVDNVIENTTSAESQIRDTDMASQMVQYSKNNILAQAGQAMLAQANQSNQGVLSLLG